MDVSLRNIAALLNGVDRPIDISDINKRKLAQKMVYLSQELGLPTNYGFSWYIHGPYSPRLTKDYYALAAQEADDEIATCVLRPEYKPIAEKLKRLLNDRPIELSEPDWAELLASVVFLRNESNYDWRETQETIQKKKSRLAGYFAIAKKALVKVPELGLA